MVSRPHEVSPISMASWLPAVTSLQATPLTAPCGRPGKAGPVENHPVVRLWKLLLRKHPGKTTY